MSIQNSPATPADWFSQARYGMVVHFGLYSLLARGEWAMNREAIARADYSRLAQQFDPKHFDAQAICDLAVRAGMRYIVFTTMHHDGFRLYDSEISDFNAMRACGRDLVAEIVAAARARGLQIGLYHSLNNWMDEPDASDTLESTVEFEAFRRNTLARLRELVTKFNPIDVLWYDGWWPFDAGGWQAERMNAELRAIQPHLLFNGRNGLSGDFSTPEGHLSAPTPWRAWEACMTLNNSWGFHAGDEEWKSPAQIVEMLATCAAGQGNLLLNIGPRGDGSVPPRSVEILESVGHWLEKHRAAIFGTDRFIFGPHERTSEHRGDWCHFGPLTASGHDLFLLARRWPCGDFALNGLEVEVLGVELSGVGPLPFHQSGAWLQIRGVPLASPDEICGVFKISCAAPPSLYGCGGLRTPQVSHPRYDPMPSDIAW